MADPFGQTLAPGESTEVWSSQENTAFDCGLELANVKVAVEYNGDFSGVVGLVLNGELSTETRVNKNQLYANLSPFGSFNVLCEDIDTISIANTGKDPITVSGTTLRLGARKRD